MRIDKFLKISRVIKRRTVAKEACDLGRVFVNERVAKAGTEVSVGDKILIRFGTNDFRFEILELSESTKKEDAAKMFRVL